MSYKLIKALPNRFEDELNKSFDDGYRLVGNPFTVQSSGYIFILVHKQPKTKKRVRNAS